MRRAKKRVPVLAGAGSNSTSYSYTARGTMASSVGPAGTVNYASDAYGQAATQGSQSYTYDALGRTLSASGTAGPFTFSYAGPGSQIASDGDGGRLSADKSGANG